MIELDSIADIISDMQEIAPTEEDYYPEDCPTPYIVVRTPNAEYYGDDNINRIRRQTILINVFVDAADKYGQIIERVRKYFAAVPYKYRETTYGYNQLFEAEFEVVAEMPLNDEGGIL